MDAARSREVRAGRQAPLFLLQRRSSRSYLTAVMLSSVAGMAGLQHFYLGRWLEGLLDLGFALGALWALMAGEGTWFLFPLSAAAGHAFIVTILLLTGKYSDGDGLRVCYPGQRLAPIQIG